MPKFKITLNDLINIYDRAVIMRDNLDQIQKKSLRMLEIKTTTIQNKRVYMNVSASKCYSVQLFW